MDGDNPKIVILGGYADVAMKLAIELGIAVTCVEEPATQATIDYLMAEETPSLYYCVYSIPSSIPSIPKAPKHLNKCNKPNKKVTRRNNWVMNQKH